MGGSKPRPTYHSLGDHTESIEIDFDPQAVSYEELVRQFFEQHSAQRPSYSRQYRSAIFVHDEGQRRIAETVVAELEAGSGQRIYTDIETAGQFWLAEDYHQKYYLKHDRTFSREIERWFGRDETALINSTAAARLSGLVGGFAPRSLTPDALAQLGLSPEAEKRAQQLLSGSARPQIMCR